MKLETRNNSNYTVTDAGNKQQNRTIRIIVIKIVFHHRGLFNVPQNEAFEASGVSIARIILFMCLVKWVTLALISGIHVQHWVVIMTQVPPCAAVRISEANLFCKTTFIICISTCSTSVVPREGTSCSAVSDSLRPHGL